MNLIDMAVKVFQYLFAAYASFMAGIIGILIARYIGAHTKNARLKVIAGLAEDAVSSQMNLDKTGEEKKLAAANLLSETIHNNLFGVNITPEEIDMRIEGAFQRIMNSKPEETNAVIDEIISSFKNKESEK